MEALIIAFLTEFGPVGAKLIINGIRTFIKTRKTLTLEQQEALLAELDEESFALKNYAKKLRLNVETGRIEVIE